MNKKIEVRKWVLYFALQEAILKSHTAYATDAPKYPDAEDLFLEALRSTINYMASYYAVSDSITKMAKAARASKQLQKKPLQADRCVSLFRYEFRKSTQYCSDRLHLDYFFSPCCSLLKELVLLWTLKEALGASFEWRKDAQTCGT